MLQHNFTPMGGNKGRKHIGCINTIHPGQCHACWEHDFYEMLNDDILLWGRM